MRIPNPDAMHGATEQREERYSTAEDVFRAIDDARLEERARCRAIVMRLFGNDWRGNDALEMLDSGEWPR